MLLKIKEERDPAEQSLFVIAEKQRWTQLRAEESAGLSAVGIGELLERGNQCGRARVIKTRESLNECAIHAERRRHRAHHAVGVEVRAKVSRQVLARAIANLDVDRRKLPRHGAVSETGQRINRIKLIATAGHQRAAKVRIEEILAATRNGQRFIGFSPQRTFFS